MGLVIVLEILSAVFGKLEIALLFSMWSHCFCVKRTRFPIDIVIKLHGKTQVIQFQSSVLIVLYCKWI